MQTQDVRGDVADVRGETKGEGEEPNVTMPTQKEGRTSVGCPSQVINSSETPMSPPVCRGTGRRATHGPADWLTGLTGGFGVEPAAMFAMG